MESGWFIDGAEKKYCDRNSKRTSFYNKISKWSYYSQIRVGCRLWKEKGAAVRKAQEFIDLECIRRMNPLTPRLTGVMIKSATLGTVIGSGQIEYLAPYARRQYYEHKTKKKWFETMKKGHKDAILKGAAKFVK